MVSDIYINYSVAALGRDGGRATCVLKMHTIQLFLFSCLASGRLEIFCVGVS